jgi:CubicO group peptidase (beta-lactamase class C family)
MFFRFITILLFSFTIYLQSCNTKTTTDKETNTSPKVLDSIQIAAIRKEINADSKIAAIKILVEAKVRAGLNGNILIAQKDIILYQGAFGFEKDSILNSKDSKFQLASLSKTFTAVATMKCVEDGLLGLDNTVQDYFPQFPYSGVTIRSLLSHRSGLPYYQYEFDKKVRALKLYPSNMDMMNWFSTAVPTPKILNQPDHFFAYNNTNFAILAALIEIVTKKSFDAYLREKILLPAGMKDTFTGVSKDSSLLINKTVGYQYGGKLQKDYYDDIIGDKGVYSTTNDLFKWYKALKSENILSKESLREMYTPRSFEHPGLRNYGYGFRLWVNDLQQTDYIYHTGWWKGYNTIMFFDLREDFVVILLSNKYNKDVYNIKEIVDVLNGNKKTNTLEDNILDQ